MLITIAIGKSRHTFDGPGEAAELDALLARLSEAVELERVAGEGCCATVYFGGRPVRCFHGRISSGVKARDVFELAMPPDPPPGNPTGSRGDGKGDAADADDGEGGHKDEPDES